MGEIGVYEAMSSLRAVRRLRPDPVPDAVLRRVLEAASWAPTGGNVQPWRVVVVRDAAKKQRLGALYAERWAAYAKQHVAQLEGAPEAVRARTAKMLAAGDHLAEHFGETPLVLVFCFNPKHMAITDADQPRVSVVGGASVYTAVENALLACRAEGLGCVLTTLLCECEPAVRELLAIPDPWYTAAAVPVGHPLHRGHGPLSRRPIEKLAYAEAWGEAWSERAVSAPETQSRVDTLAAARALAPALAERAGEIEAARRLPADLAERFAREGFYRMCVPALYGGLELPPAETMQTIEALAQADGSCAWCVFIGATSGSVLALLPPASAREIFSHPEVRLGGVFAPRGVAVACEGGFRVNGRWAWGSGTENCHWVMGGCQVIRDGEPELLRNGTPRSRMMLAPVREVEFFDTWHVSGLCGTGSTDFAMHDLFVPAAHAVGLGVDGPLERPLYAFPQFGLLAMGIAAVSLGLARAAIDALVELAAGKTPAGSARSLAARASTQSEVSKAEAALRASRAFYYETIEAAWESACTRGSIDAAQRRDVRLATTHATRACAGAVDRMYDLGGGSSVYRSSPLQRIFRDVHVATQHMMVSPAILELTGRLLLGLETDTTLL